MALTFIVHLTFGTNLIGILSKRTTKLACIVTLDIWNRFDRDPFKMCSKITCRETLDIWDRFDRDSFKMCSKTYCILKLDIWDRFDRDTFKMCSKITCIVTLDIWDKFDRGFLQNMQQHMRKCYNRNLRSRLAFSRPRIKVYFNLE